MIVTRREFLERGAGSVSLFSFALVKVPGFPWILGAMESGEKVAEIPVVWMATGSCTGCSVALLNAAAPTIQETLLGEVLPGKHLSLGFHATVMAASGEPAIDTLKKVAEANRGKYVLVVDGATATKENGLYCAIGEVGDKPIPGYQWVRDLGRDAMAVLGVGACAAFGGIPAAGPNPTGAVPVSEVFKREKIATPLVNIPGCPPHPDWIVGTIATLLLGGVPALKLDEHHRPAPFFGETVHDNCAYRSHFDKGHMAQHFGEHGCLFKLGCKGPITYSDCPVRKFNNGTSWCCQAGHPCIGCCRPDFPFPNSLYSVVEHSVISEQALDENHAAADCTSCHVDHRFDRTPTCDSCHEPKDGITFPAKRPGPYKAVSGSK